ncbi:MAG: hypothetical protein JRK26_06405 [Deltaproteobacteria bacterium]|nr:hypothetical protein [Deltaproteobacteria bacterium]
MRNLLCVSAMIVLSVAVLAGSAFAQGIRPWPENPCYWEFRGKPELLLGGSIDDDLFQCEGFEQQLDTLVACGGNVIRNTMSSSDTTRPWPFAKTGDKYDLDRFNPEYWDRFSRLLEAASRRNVVVQVEIWATFNYYRESWTLFNPFNPAHNINYTPEESGLPTVNSSHPTRADNPFFRTVPKYMNNKVVLPYQERFVDKILSCTLNYDNVLYAMDNETSADPRWGEYWAEYIKKKALGAGREVYVTEMWDPWDLKHEWHLYTIDHPETYNFLDVSQNNWQEGQRHQDALAYVRERISDNPRPINNTKVYAMRGGERWLNSRLAVSRFWGNVWGGCASTRFHRPTPAGHGIGINHNARRAIKGIRELLAHFDIFHSTVQDRLLKDRAEDEAYCLGCEGRSWAVMFPDGGRVLLDVQEAPEGARFEVRWFDADYLAWQEPYQIEAASMLPLGTPGNGRWVALINLK